MEATGRPAAVRAQFGATLRRVLDLLLPPACMACAKPLAEGGALCSGCWSAIRWIERPFCERLAIPFGHDIGAGALSAEAIAHPPPFARLRAACVYGAEASHVVQALKYHDRTELAAPLAALMTRALGPIAAEVDVVLPVPLHRSRLWQRRFNQSALVATSVAERIGRPFAPAMLERIRPTRRQVGLKASERARNVEGAFRVPPDMRPSVAGRRLLLVDDVYTTGATVKAATRALNRAGAASVDVLVFARVVEGMG